MTLVRLKAWTQRSWHCTLGALVLIIENVVALAEEDGIHGVFTELDDCLTEGGMQLVGLWKLCDGCMGGCTGRQRVFPCWERIDMASCLPPWCEGPQAVAPSTVRDHLLPVHQTQHLAIGGQSKFVKTESSVDASSVHCGATQVGYLVLKGPEDEWMCGEGLKLEDDGRVWRVFQITRAKLKIFFDSRSQPEFRWLRKDTLCFSQRGEVRWPVWSVDGVAKAIRHTNFAPGDLFLDDRDGQGIVRPLSDQEKWKIMGLAQNKAEILKRLGMEKELGQLAGNSIPSRMADAVAAEAASRVAQYKRLIRARERGNFVLMSPAAGLYSSELHATFLIVLELSSQSVLLWNQCKVPGMVHAVSQQQAFDHACSWAGDLGMEEAAKRAILLEKPMGESRARAVICF